MSDTNHRSTEVPASAAGSIFQLERALLHLASHPPGFSVGVELDDDVSVEGDSFRIFEQDKLTFQNSGSPVADRSWNLWNTLYIWCHKYSTSPFTRGKHELWLVTNASGHTKLAKLLNGAQTEDAAKEAIEELKLKATSQIKDLQTLMTKVITFPENILIEVILAFRLLDASSGQKREDLEKETVSLLRLPSGYSEQIVLYSLKGWLQQSLMELWQNKKPGLIAVQAYVDQRHAILNDIKQQIIRERPYGSVVATEEDKANARVELFVRLLLEIEVSDEMLEIAVDNFVRFNTEHLRLLSEGSVLPTDWVSFFESLVHRWGEIRATELMDTEGEHANKLAKRILLKTAHNQHCGFLGGTQTVHPYFTSGSYHRLANDKRVGWHPTFVAGVRPR